MRGAALLPNRVRGRVRCAATISTVRYRKLDFRAPDFCAIKISAHVFCSCATPKINKIARQSFLTKFRQDYLNLTIVKLIIFLATKVHNQEFAKLGWVRGV